MHSGNLFSGVKEEMDTDIAETEKRREEIFRTSLHEDQLEEGLSEISGESPEEVSPVEETKVILCL